jgi:hypothetical protein
MRPTRLFGPSIFILAAALASAGCCGHSRSVFNSPPYRAYVVSKAGDRVLLQNTGGKGAKDAFCPEEIAKVYRHTGNGLSPVPTGWLKLSDVGVTYIEAKVVQGDIRPGDIMTKDSAACRMSPLPSVR